MSKVIHTTLATHRLAQPEKQKEVFIHPFGPYHLPPDGGMLLPSEVIMLSGELSFHPIHVHFRHILEVPSRPQTLPQPMSLPL